jgi:hypothetical protein
VPTEVSRAKGPEGEFLRGAGIDKHWVTSSGYMSCVSPSGKWLGHEPSTKVLEAFGKLPKDEREPNAVKVPDLKTSEAVIPTPPEGGLVLRVHGRFLGRDDTENLRPVKGHDFPQLRGKESAIRSHQFLFEPNTEYMWMTKEEWQSLVPAKPVKGDRLAVASAISERMARFHLSPRRALTSEDGIVAKKVWGRWGDANGKSQTIERSGRSPIGFAFELAKGGSPTDRLPPAGHGGRALRAGYFAASK